MVQIPMSKFPAGRSLTVSNEAGRTAGSIALVYTNELRPRTIQENVHMTSLTSGVLLKSLQYHVLPWPSAAREPENVVRPLSLRSGFAAGSPGPSNRGRA